MSGPVGDHTLHELNRPYLTMQIQNLQNSYTTQNKNLGGEGAMGGGLRQINTCRKVPLQVQFLDDGILIWCLVN